jgi:hypothetical protein
VPSDIISHSQYETPNGCFSIHEYEDVAPLDLETYTTTLHYNATIIRYNEQGYVRRNYVVGYVAERICG